MNERLARVMAWIQGAIRWIGAAISWLLADQWLHLANAIERRTWPEEFLANLELDREAETFTEEDLRLLDDETRRDLFGK